MSLVAQSCPTLCNPLDCSLPGSFVHGVFQARILKWVVIPFSRTGQNGLKQKQNQLLGWFLEEQTSLLIRFHYYGGGPLQ